MNKLFYIIIIIIFLNLHAEIFDLNDVTEQAIQQGKKVNQVVRDREAEEERRYQEWKRNHPEAFQNTAQSHSSSSQPSTQSSSSSSSSNTNVRGMKNIRSSGTYIGYPSWRIECNNGSSRNMFLDRNGHWHANGSTSDMGSRYDSWSKEEVANYICKEL